MTRVWMCVSLEPVEGGTAGGHQGRGPRLTRFTSPPAPWSSVRTRLLYQCAWPHLYFFLIGHECNPLSPPAPLCPFPSSSTSWTTTWTWRRSWWSTAATHWPSRWGRERGGSGVGGRVGAGWEQGWEQKWERGWAREGMEGGLREPKPRCAGPRCKGEGAGKPFKGAVQSRRGRVEGNTCCRLWAGVKRCRQPPRHTSHTHTHDLCYPNTRNRAHTRPHPLHRTWLACSSRVPPPSWWGRCASASPTPSFTCTHTTPRVRPAAAQGGGGGVGCGVRWRRGGWGGQA
mgnify:CR=1 FL=1